MDENKRDSEGPITVVLVVCFLLSVFLAFRALQVGSDANYSAGAEAMLFGGYAFLCAGLLLFLKWATPKLTSMISGGSLVIIGAILIVAGMILGS